MMGSVDRSFLTGLMTTAYPLSERRKSLLLLPCQASSVSLFPRPQTFGLKVSSECAVYPDENSLSASSYLVSRNARQWGASPVKTSDGSKSVVGNLMISYHIPLNVSAL